MNDRLSGVQVGDELPPSERAVGVEDLGAYAEASGDRNPLHLDDAFARSVGFPGVIAHGMFTLGHLASMLDAWVGADGEVTSLRAQFRSPVFPGDTLVARGPAGGLGRGATRRRRRDAGAKGGGDRPLRLGRAGQRLSG